jgi:ABC-type lipoprotein release transport system permease subunit
MASGSFWQWGLRAEISRQLGTGRPRTRRRQRRREEEELGGEGERQGSWWRTPVAALSSWRERRGGFQPLQGDDDVRDGSGGRRRRVELTSFLESENSGSESQSESSESKSGSESGVADAADETGGSGKRRKRRKLLQTGDGLSDVRVEEEEEKRCQCCCSPRFPCILGVLVVALAVFVLAALETGLARAPYVFLAMAELEEGQVDVQIGPRRSESQFAVFSNGTYDRVVPSVHRRVNYTLAAKVLRSDASLGNHSPRIMVGSSDVQAIPQSACRAVSPYAAVVDDAVGCQELGTCFFANCFQDFTNDAVDELPVFSATLAAVDTAKETKIGLGSAWTLPPVPRGSCYVHSDLASEIEAAAQVATVIGEVLWLQINASRAFGELWLSRVPPRMAVGTSVVSTDFVTVPFEIAGTFSPGLTSGSARAVNGGRFSTYDRDLVVVEIEGLWPHVVDNLDPLLSTEVALGGVSTVGTSLRGADLLHFVSQLVFRFPPRGQKGEITREVYIEQDWDGARDQIVKGMANKLSYMAGFPRVHVDLPVLSSLSQTREIAMLLGLVLDIALVVLTTMCCMLVYSLLTIDISAQLREFAILRAVGIRRTQLVYLLVVRIVPYALPGLVAGLATAQLALLIAQLAISSIEIGSGALTVVAVVSSCVLVAVVPILSGWAPVRRVFDLSLRDSLIGVFSHRSIRIERGLSSYSLSAIVRSRLPHVLLGLLLTAFGVLACVILPSALVSLNFRLLVDCLLLLLVGLIAALTMLTFNFLPMLERAVSVLLVWSWARNSGVWHIFRGNLASHRRQKRLVSVLFAIGVALMCFLAVSYNLQVEAFLFNQRSSGVLLNVYAGRDRSTGKRVPLRPETVEALYSWQAANQDVVSDIAWVSMPLEDVTCRSPVLAQGNFSAPSLPCAYALSNVGKLEDSTFYQEVSTVSPNLLGVTRLGSAEISPSVGNHPSSATKDDLFEYLNSVRGFASAAIEARIASRLLGSSRSVLFAAEDKANDWKRTSAGFRRLTAAVGLDRVPYFSVSIFPRTPDFGEKDHSRYVMLVSPPKFTRLGLEELGDMLPVDHNIHSLLFDVSPKGGGQVADEVPARSPEWDTVVNQVEAVIARVGDENARTWNFQSSAVRALTARRLLSAFFAGAVALIMILCAFALASSFIALLHSDRQHIAILRAVGVPSRTVLILLVLEAFVTVLSSSLIGLCVGLALSGLVFLNQAMLLQMPLVFSFPWELLGVVVVCAVFDSIAAVYIPARNTLKKDIPSLLRG